jgi:ABC-type uncharacterized transport system involved in gliding motility auxiliary subunit
MKPLSRRLYAIAALALAAVLFVALNIAVDATLTNTRLDLTQNGRFTLSKGTRHIVETLEEPITLRFFYSKEIAANYAQTKAYADRVRDLLERYAALSHGKIVLEEIDPQPYTPAEDEATSYGMTPAPTDSGDQVYFGLAGSNAIDGKDAIAYFAPEREPYLEYDITSLIYRLANPKKPKVAVISSLPLDTGLGGMQAMMQGQGRPFLIYQELAQTYDTTMLRPDFAAIPPGTDVLMIVQPGQLSDEQTYAIDQFVMGGGRVLAFVDPNSELAQQASGADPSMAPPAASTLPRLFQSWGIDFNANKIIGDLKLAQRVRTSDDPRNPVALYPVWLHLDHGQFDASDPITANLQVLNLASVGALAPRKGATTHFAPLVWSSEQAALLGAEEVRLSPQPEDLVSSIIPTGKRYTIAARISGPADTAFPNGPPSAGGAPEVKSAKNVNIVVMADSDIFDDRFWVRVENVLGRQVAAPFADNAAFVLNAVENLMGSDDLISLRTRASDDRPFTVVRDLQAQAEAQFQEQEQGLQARLTDTQQKLQSLQAGEGGAAGNVALTPAQQAAVERFKRELIVTRAELREVQHNLRKDIDALGEFLAFVNIALMPLLVAGFALVVAALRRRRRRKAVQV